VQGPEFKPQNDQRKKEEKKKNQRLSWRHRKPMLDLFERNYIGL
jgi:hypothetical protein